MHFACRLPAVSPDILHGMTNESKYNTQEQLPGALEKIDVRLPGEMKARLEEIARREQRSGNKQAVYYIENGVNGIDLPTLAASIMRIESMLAAVLKKLDEK